MREIFLLWGLASFHRDMLLSPINSFNTRERRALRKASLYRWKTGWDQLNLRWRQYLKPEVESTLLSTESDRTMMEASMATWKDGKMVQHSWSVWDLVMIASQTWMRESYTFYMHAFFLANTANIHACVGGFCIRFRPDEQHIWGLHAKLGLAWVVPFPMMTGKDRQYHNFFVCDCMV